MDDSSMSGRRVALVTTFVAVAVLAVLFTVLRWTVPMKIDLSPWPNVAAYLERVGKRPKVREALQAEGLIPKQSSATA